MPITDDEIRGFWESGGRERQKIITLLESILAEVTRDERDSASLGQDEWLVREVHVVTAGTEVQGPDIAVGRGPDGYLYQTIVRQRRHAGSPAGYVANQSGGPAGSNRHVFADGDSMQIRVSNWKKLFFDADTDDTYFELGVER